jgi:hypothetical protein
MWLLPEGQTGEARKTSTKQSCFVNKGAPDVKIFPIFPLERLNAPQDNAGRKLLVFLVLLPISMLRH